MPDMGIYRANRNRSMLCRNSCKKAPLQPALRRSKWLFDLNGRLVGQPSQRSLGEWLDLVVHKRDRFRLASVMDRHRKCLAISRNLISGVIRHFAFYFVNKGQGMCIDALPR